MLDPPNLPVKPDKPNRIKLSLIGLVLGIVLGGASAAGTEVLGGKVYTEREIKNLLPFEVIAEIPSLETPAEESRARRSVILAAAAAMLAFMIIVAGTAITYLRG